MSNPKSLSRIDPRIVEVKSKFVSEFRRFSVDKTMQTNFEEFYKLVEGVHGLKNVLFLICYTDFHGDLLPINNNDNFRKALDCSKPLLKLLVEKKGSLLELQGFGSQNKSKKGVLSKIIGSNSQQENMKMKPGPVISLPEDFRRVSAIIDVDVIPESQRRVKLMKNGQEKPLGFYIRDGTSVRVTAAGLEKVPSIFISRLVPGGLAESTGLLAVNDEVIEVNGISVQGKLLDQVTDMMVANSSNLILTVKPANQKNNISPKRNTKLYLNSNIIEKSSHSHNPSIDSNELVDEEDEVHVHIPNSSSFGEGKNFKNSSISSRTRANKENTFQHSDT